MVFRDRYNPHVDFKSSREYRAVSNGIIRETVLGYGRTLRAPDHAIERGLKTQAFITTTKGIGNVLIPFFLKEIPDADPEDIMRQFETNLRFNGLTFLSQGIPVALVNDKSPNIQRTLRHELLHGMSFYNEQHFGFSLLPKRRLLDELTVELLRLAEENPDIHIYRMDNREKRSLTEIFYQERCGNGYEKGMSDLEYLFRKASESGTPYTARQLASYFFLPEAENAQLFMEDLEMRSQPDFRGRQFASYAHQFLYR